MVIFESFKRCPTLFRVAGVTLCDVATCFITWQKVYKSRSARQAQCFCKVFERWRAFLRHSTHFVHAHLHFVWQAQHFRRVVLRVFCESHCQSCVKWRWCANSVAGVGHRGKSHFAWQRQYLVQICCVSHVILNRRNIWDTLHFTLHTLHLTLHTLHFTLHSLHFTLHTLQFTLYTHAACSTLDTLHSTLHCTLYTPHSTLYTPHSTLYTLHSTLYTLHSTLDTRHFTLHNSHFIPYTLHSPLNTPLLAARDRALPKVQKLAAATGCNIYEVFLSMCFDICAINIRVSIRVHGPHLASSAWQASYFVHVAKRLEARVEIKGDVRSQKSFFVAGSMFGELGGCLKGSKVSVGEADVISVLVYSQAQFRGNGNTSETSTKKLQKPR